MNFLNQNVRSWVSAVTLSAFAGTTIAAPNIDSSTQQVQRVDLRRQLLQQPAVEAIPPLYKDETEDIGPQFIVKQKPKRQLFEAAFDIQFGNTNNMNLTETARTETSLAVTTLQLAIAPTPFKFDDGSSLALKGGYRHQKFNYGKFQSGEALTNDADFDVSTFFAQGRYTFHENWVATAGLDYNRLLTADRGQYDEFYSEVVPNVGLERLFKVDDKSAVVVSSAVNYHVSHVDPPQADKNDRVDEVLMASYIREIVPEVVVQPFYRAQFTEYLRNPNHNRKDITQTVGVALSYAITKWASARLYANFEQRDSSDVNTPDYQKLDSGIGMTFQIRF